MNQLNLVKENKDYYTAKSEPELKNFGAMKILSIVGQGEPTGTNFTRSVEALYPLAYGIRKIYKEKEMIFAVPKLEGLWWVNSDRSALEIPKSEWNWKLLIRMPDFIKKEIFELAVIEVIKKKGIDLVSQIEFETINEGKCVQAMHIGPYSTEPETLQKIYEFIKEKDLAINGLHHEIYISDPRKIAPEKMKTILRYPVK